MSWQKDTQRYWQAREPVKIEGGWILPTYVDLAASALARCDACGRWISTLANLTRCPRCGGRLETEGRA